MAVTVASRHGQGGARRHDLRLDRGRPARADRLARQVHDAVAPGWPPAISDRQARGAAETAAERRARLLHVAREHNHVVAAGEQLRHEARPGRTRSRRKSRRASSPRRRRRRTLEGGGGGGGGGGVGARATCDDRSRGGRAPTRDAQEARDNSEDMATCARRARIAAARERRGHAVVEARAVRRRSFVLPRAIAHRAREPRATHGAIARDASGTEVIFIVPSEPGRGLASSVGRSHPACVPV